MAIVDGDADFEGYSAFRLLERALSRAWKASVEDIVERVFFFDLDKDDERIEREIGLINGAPFVYEVGIVLRPDA